MKDGSAYSNGKRTIDDKGSTMDDDGLDIFKGK